MNTFIRQEISKTVVLMNAILDDEALLATVADIGALCADAIRDDGKILFCGNGGSAADCQHLAAELVGKLLLDRPGLPSVALTTDTSALTAIANDFGYEHVFARQVEAIGRSGDVLVAISTSGRSPNILRALETARRKQLTTVGMTGAGGGAMADLCDYCLCVPSTETQKIQEGHIVLGHIVCELTEAAMMAGAEDT